MQQKKAVTGNNSSENTTSPGRSATTRGKTQAQAEESNNDAHTGQDYRDASGRDHPAESEHDHAHQKLNGKSADMANDKSPRVDPAKR